MVAHNEANHKEQRAQSYDCEKCNLKSENKDSLSKHIKEMHYEEELYECNSCDFKSNSKDSIPIHKKDNHSVTFNYTKCDFPSEIETELQTHDMNEHTYKCGVCDFSAKDKEILEKHIKSEHSKVDSYKRIFTCEYCEY